MSKKFKYIFVLCLSLCLVLSACGVDDTENNKDIPTGDDSVIYAPTDGNSPEQTQDTTDEDTVGTIEDNTTDLQIPEDTTVKNEPMVDPEPVTTPEVPEEETNQPEETEDIPDQPDETEPVEIPSDTVDVITFDEAFLVGDPISGSFVSQQSEKMQLVVNYHCQLNIDDSITVDLQLGLECYDVNCGARADGGKLIINDDIYTFSTDAIVHAESERIYIPFTTYTYELDAGETSCSIDASWFFNGVYAGTKIDTLTAGAVLEWGVPCGDGTIESAIE